MAELDPRTLRSVARLLRRERRDWVASAEALGSLHEYSRGFRYGMAEMARRAGDHCLEKAKAIETKRNSGRRVR